MRWIVLLVLFCAVAARARAAAAPRIGDLAPPILLPTLGGAKMRLGGPAGLPTVVDFSATWCGPCHLAQAALAAIAVQLGPAIALVVVDEGEDPATVAHYYAAHPLPPGVKVVLDEHGDAGRSWGEWRLPTAFLLDGRGVVRHIDRGVGPGYKPRIARWLRAMLTI